MFFKKLNIVFLLYQNKLGLLAPLGTLTGVELVDGLARSKVHESWGTETLPNDTADKD